MTYHNENEFERPKAGFRLLLATGASIFALGLGTVAIAQEVETTSQAAEEAAEEDLITVTGSRIKRPGIDTVRPVISLSTEDFDKRAFTNIADALNEIPAFGTPVSPDGGQNAFTVGQNFVNLFNLGTQRTLTLIDGRRFVSSNVPVAFGSAGGLQVDLNSIPVALIERIDVVPLAGAAVYGSDAIAGTVNVILRDDYEGAEFGGQYGVTEFGDFQTYQAQAVFGANTQDGRGNSTLSVEYNEQQGGLLSARPSFFSGDPNLVNFGQQDLNGDGVNDDVDGDGDADTFSRIFFDQVVQLFGPGGSVSPGFTTIPSIGVGSLADGNFYEFNPDSTLSSCVPGISPGASSLFFAQGGTCGIDFFDTVNQIRTPLERVVISSASRYDFLPNVRGILQTTFANSRASELVNQGGFQTFAFGGSSGALSFNTSNPFLTDQARGILESNGLTTFGLNRFNNDIVNSGENSTENFTFRVVTALEGTFEAADRNFNWDASAVFGASDVETRTFGIVDGRFFNAIDAVSVNDALLQTIVDAGFAADLNGALDTLNRTGLSGVNNISRGDIICDVSARLAAGDNTGTGGSGGNGATAAGLPFAEGCVPLNLFGQGAASPEAIAFINGAPRITSSDIEQRVFTANFGGELFNLPAGWINFNLGFENRRDNAVFTPGLGTALNITRSAPFLTSGGQAETIEFYGEVAIPIINRDMNIPGFNFLEINASGRTVSNTIGDVNNPTESTTRSDDVYEINGRWSPVEDIIFRASYTSAIRAPSLVELFSPSVQAFLFASDPCDSRFITGGPSPELRAANCATVGITQPFTSNVVNASIIGATSGNSELLSERAESFNIGAIIEPRWVDNLTVQVDYFNINIADRIVGLNLTQILGACFDSTTFGAGNPFCSENLFIRDATGQIVTGRTTSLNAGLSEYQSIQFQVAYNFDIADALTASKLFKNRDYSSSDFGNLDFRVNALRSIENTTQTLDALPIDTISTFADPTWSGNFDTTYTRGPWRAFWRASFQDAPTFNVLQNSFVLDANDQIIEFGGRVIHNASLSYTFNEKTSLQIGVNNVTDRKVDDAAFAAGFFTVVEQLGRSYTFRLRSRF